MERTDQSRPKTPTFRDFLAISLFWLPASLFWGAMLGQMLPDRVIHFSGEASKGTYIAIIGGLGAIASTVVQLLIGAMSDACGSRWGRRRPFIFWGTVCAIPSLFLFAYSGSFGMLVIAFLLIQFWINVANGPYQALIPDHVPREYHGRAAMFMGVAQLIGQAGGPVGSAILLGMAKSEHAPFSQTTAMLIVMGAVSVLLLIGMLVTLTAVPDSPAPADVRRPMR
ncbi:MAG: MFS transporter, partial [Burkholderiales bacterium]